MISLYLDSYSSDGTAGIQHSFCLGVVLLEARFLVSVLELRLIYSQRIDVLLFPLEIQTLGGGIKLDSSQNVHLFSIV